MKLSEIFEEVVFSQNFRGLVDMGPPLNCKGAEFPLAILFGDKITNPPAFIYNTNKLFKSESEDFVAIPFILDGKENLDEMAGQTLLAAAADRNIIVYDSNAKSGIFTEKLLLLMQQVMARNSGGGITRHKLTDVFVHEKADLTNINYLNINKIPENIYKKLKFFYMEDIKGLKACLADNDVEFVIGVDLVRNDSFVRPTHDGKYGLGVLDNRRILLGSY